VTEADMSCEQVLMRVLDFVDRELAEEDRTPLERHLETCRSCFSRVEFERRLKARLSELPAEQAPSAVRERVARLIAGF
jgi:anti-sigma factor (TIGR02949 family)